ncbi:MAG: discoidin domain-containing protein [Candidatus Symbiothrix sp.]|jgi:hypothetical protein|nr:discoidin domain-containing protein [Candidatus Symbiothrix sp.]
MRLIKQVAGAILLCLVMQMSVLAENRVKTNIGNGWKFQKNTSASPSAAAYDDSSWETVNIPHTWNATDAQDGGGNYARTIGWYRKTIAWDASFAGKRVYLEVLAASLQADCYVNGVLLGTHKGGYNAFRFDITDQLTTGNNVVAIKVNNQAIGDIAPLSGDFSVIGGIYRKIFLVVADPVHVDLNDYASTGLYLTTSEVSASSAKLEIRAKVVNQSTAAKTVDLQAVLKNPDTFDAIAEVPQPLFDVTTMAPGGTIQTLQSNAITIPAGGSYEFKQTLTVTNPHLWDGLTDPYRYLVDFTVAEGGTVIDSVSDYVGFRYFSADNTGFYLNGRLYPLRGVNRHQDWKDMGYAISEHEHNVDFGMIYEIGANAVRLAHYPQDPYFHELFDKYGIVIWVEIPFVDKFGTDTAQFMQTTRLQLIEMIRQRYNRPSIMMWGLQNEVSTSSYDAQMSQIIPGLHALVKSEDPTGRLTTQAQAGTERPGWRTDLYGQNRYPGWYQSGTFGAYIDGERSKYVLNGVQLPIGISEYGAGGNPAQHEIVTLSGTTVPSAPYGHQQPWHPEEYQNKIHEMAIKDLATRSWIWGTFVWNMFDFASDSRAEGEQPGINDKGLVTHDRKTKKDSFYAYKANWSNEPTIYIASRRFVNRETATTPVKVYTNCESVELFVNNVSQGSLSRTAANCGLLEWTNIALPQKGLNENGANVVIAKGVRAGVIYSDTVKWYRTPSSSTDLTSTSMLVDNVNKTIGIGTPLQAENVQQAITAASGATLVLVDADGVTPITSGAVNPGMKLIVTAEDGVTVVVYEFIMQHIAYKKAVTSSGSETANPAANAVDGDATTRWAAPNGNANYIYVNLGKDYIINKVAVQWYDNAATPRAYKYTVQTRKNGLADFTTIIDHSDNTQSGYISDTLPDVTARFVKIDVTGATISTAYPSIYEIQINGWMIASSVYTINFTDSTITVPYSENIIPIEDFLSRITFSGNEMHHVESAAYYIVEGAQLVIADSNGKETPFTIHFSADNGISALPAVSPVFAASNKNENLHIRLNHIANAHVEISDVAGKKLFSRDVHKETTVVLPKDVYLIQVSSEQTGKSIIKYLMQ